MARLQEIKSEGSGQLYELASDGSVIGRSEQCQVQITDHSVSRMHARILHLNGRYVIEDLGSSHGTLVNDRPVKRQSLAHRDVIQLGNTRLLFEQWSVGTVNLDADEPTLSGDVTTIDAVSRLLGDAPIATGSEEELRRLADRLQTVYAVAEAISNTLDVDELLAQILDRLLEVFPGCGRGFLLLVDASGELVPRAVKCRHKEDESLTVSRAIVHEVMSQGRAVLSVDAMEDDRFKGRDSVIVLETRAFMAAPLVSRGATLGLVYLDSKVFLAFTPDDLELLVGLAGQAAGAVGIARLHDEVMRRESLAQDLRVAERIQQSFLPRGVPSIDGYQFAAHYDPAHEIGGDFYDFIPLPEGRLGIAIGDVSGKGVSAALYMARLTRELRYLAAAEADPARVLARANLAVMDNERDDMFVTLLYAVLDPFTRRLVFSSAGHLPPLMRRPAPGDARLVVDTGGGLPLGIAPDAEYSTQGLELAKGDTVMLFTDGVLEAKSPAGVMYGTERLLAAAGDGPADTGELMARVMRDVHAHVATAPQSDDTTIVCLGVPGRPTRDSRFDTPPPRGRRNTLPP